MHVYAISQNQLRVSYLQFIGSSCGFTHTACVINLVEMKTNIYTFYIIPSNPYYLIFHIPGILC